MNFLIIFFLCLFSVTTWGAADNAQTPAPTTMADLPDEMLEQILTHFPNEATFVAYARSSKNTYKLAKQHVLNVWKKRLALQPNDSNTIIWLPAQNASPAMYTERQEEIIIQLLLKEAAFRKYLRDHVDYDFFVKLRALVSYLKQLQIMARHYNLVLNPQVRILYLDIKNRFLKPYGDLYPQNTAQEKCKQVATNACCITTCGLGFVLELALMSCTSLAKLIALCTVSDSSPPLCQKFAKDKSCTPILWAVEQTPCYKANTVPCFSTRFIRQIRAGDAIKALLLANPLRLSILDTRIDQI